MLLWHRITKHLIISCYNIKIYFGKYMINFYNYMIVLSSIVFGLFVLSLCIVLLVVLCCVLVFEKLVCACVCVLCWFVGLLFVLLCGLCCVCCVFVVFVFLLLCSLCRDLVILLRSCCFVVCVCVCLLFCCCLLFLIVCLFVCFFSFWFAASCNNNATGQWHWRNDSDNINVLALCSTRAPAAVSTGCSEGRRSQVPLFKNTIQLDN